MILFHNWFCPYIQAQMSLLNLSENVFSPSQIHFKMNIFRLALGQKIWRWNYELILQFDFCSSRVSLIIMTTELLHTQLQTWWQLPLQDFVNLISYGDWDNLGTTELKTLTDFSFNIVVNTQTTLLCTTRQDRLFQANKS